MSENNQQITKEDLKDFGKEINTGFDEKLGKFTDDVLLPAIEGIVKDTVKTEVKSEIGKHRHEMKEYIDSKLSENKGDIIAYIKGDKERDKNWKIKVSDILKREKIAKQQELELLEN